VSEHKLILSRSARLLEEELYARWETGLKKWGIPYPNGAHLPALLAMYERMPFPLSQAYIADWYTEHSDIVYNRQIRHLASDGWDIRSGNKRYTQGVCDIGIKANEVRLAQIEAPSPVWTYDDKLKRTGSISTFTWEEKLMLYTPRGCAVCGQKHSHYDKGHLDPTLGYSNANIVPMCPDCNNWAADRIIFKLDGLIARPTK
jgi:hypothetical protein